MEKEKVLKGILIVLIIFILLFFVNLGRKTAILIAIENKRAELNEIDNIYYKSEYPEIIAEMFLKGDIAKETTKIKDTKDDTKAVEEIIAI